MPARPRLVLASLLLYVTACGLVYDVDSVSTDYKTCGTQGKPCCAGNVCGDNLACVAAPSGADASTPDAGDAATEGGDAAPPSSTGCDCPDAAADASGLDGAPDVSSVDASGGCTCNSFVCKHCGDPGEPCCTTSVDAYDACNASELKCTQGRCTGCGEKGEDCCSGIVRCATDQGLSCSGGKCVAQCGADGQTCCNGQCDPGLTCNPQGHCEAAACGANGEPCCGTGAKCATGDLACLSGTCTSCGLQPGDPCCQSTTPCTAGMMCDGTQHCISCGGEGQPCCPPPTGCSGALRCGGDGACHTCPSVGTWCGSTQPNGYVCLGVGDGSQCAHCGKVGEPCCPGGVPDQACPGTQTCCNGSGNGCTLCNTGSCTCKVCCVQCGNWKSTSYQRIPAPGNDCPTAAAAYCTGKGGKTYGQWSPHCP